MKVPERIRALAEAMRTAPWKIADIFGASPVLAEETMRRRGQRCRDGESLYDCIARHYGEGVAREFNDCIGLTEWEVQ